MSRLLFVNRFYWPETPATGQLLTDLAESLAQSGRDVTVVTSRGGTGDAPHEEQRAGVRIVRIRTPRWAQRSVLGKALAFLAFWMGGSWQLLRRVRSGDTVITLTDPPLFGTVTWLVCRFKRAQVIHWIQDIYPEVAVELTGHRWMNVFRPARDAAWRGANACVTLGSEMASLVRQAGVPDSQIRIIPNWAPAGLTTITPGDHAVRLRRESWGVEGRFVIGYSGNLGRVHDLEPVISAAEMLRGEANILFLFIGSGAQRDALAARAKERDLSNVRFLPSQPRNDLGVSLAAADVHLITLRPGCEFCVFPSKVYGVAAVGRPILFVGPPQCELAQLVTSHQLGAAIDRDEPDQLAAVIRRWSKDPAQLARYRKAAADFGGVHHTERSLAAWRAVIEDVEACRSGRTAVSAQT